MITIKTKELSKRFKNRVAVDQLNLSIDQGEMFAILGENGAGKSTIINMLTCLTKPSNGDAEILDYSILTESREIKKFINVSPQETAVGNRISVRENLEFVARLYGYSKEQAQAKTQELLRIFQLEQRANEYPRKLSGGMQRKLSIAMALVSEPKILFLDEPTLGLDVRARRELWENIRATKGKITIILTTHYLEEAEALADRIAIINEGKLMALGTPKEIISKAEVNNFEDAFLKLSSKEVI